MICHRAIKKQNRNHGARNQTLLLVAQFYHLIAQKAGAISTHSMILNVKHRMQLMIQMLTTNQLKHKPYVLITLMFLLNVLSVQDVLKALKQCLDVCAVKVVIIMIV